MTQTFLFTADTVTRHIGKRRGGSNNVIDGSIPAGIKQKKISDASYTSNRLLQVCYIQLLAQAEILGLQFEKHCRNE